MMRPGLRARFLAGSRRFLSSAAVLRGALLAFAVLGLGHAVPAAACSVCFSDTTTNGPLRWAIGLLLALVLAVQAVLGSFLWRLLRGRSPVDTSSTNVPAVVEPPC
jgi:hypothetical protein